MRRSVDRCRRDPRAVSASVMDEFGAPASARSARPTACRIQPMRSRSMIFWSTALQREVVGSPGTRRMTVSVTLQFCGAARTVTGSCYLFETPRGTLSGRLRPVPGTENAESAELWRLSVSPRRHRYRAADPRAYRPQRLAAKARARRLSRPDHGDARHHRPLLLHAARRGKHPGDGGRRPNRRNAARGRPRSARSTPRPMPLPSLDAFRPVEYETWFEVMPGVRARYWNAGHLLGSASIELEFAGKAQPESRCGFLLPATSAPTPSCCSPIRRRRAGFDYVISESTYGDSDRPPTTAEARRARLASEVRDAAQPTRARCLSPPLRSSAPRN